MNTNTIEGSFQHLRKVTSNRDSGVDLNYSHSRRSWSINRGLGPREGFWKFLKTIIEVYNPNRGCSSVLNDDQKMSILLCPLYTPRNRYNNEVNRNSPIVTRSKKRKISEIYQDGDVNCDSGEENKESS